MYRPITAQEIAAPGMCGAARHFSSNRFVSRECKKRDDTTLAGARVLIMTPARGIGFPEPQM